MRNHNRKRIKLENDVWASVPDDYVLTPQDELELIAAGEAIERLTQRKIHAIHLNSDLADQRELHSVNIVLHHGE